MGATARKAGGLITADSSARGLAAIRETLGHADPGEVFRRRADRKAELAKAVHEQIAFPLAGKGEALVQPQLGRRLAVSGNE
jgi:hypothetical protein